MAPFDESRSDLNDSDPTDHDQGRHELPTDRPNTPTSSLPTYDLFDVPSDLLDHIQHEIQRDPRPPRYVNLWFKDLEKITPLVRGGVYDLCVSIGDLDVKSIVDWENKGRREKVDQIEQAEPHRYDLGAIRKLVMAAFTPDTLDRFCWDRPTFSGVRGDFPRNASLNQMIDTLFEYSTTRLLLSELLEQIKEYNPGQYERYERQSGRSQNPSPTPSNMHPDELGVPLPIIEPLEIKQLGAAELFVSVFSEDFEVEEPTCILTLPPSSDSAPVQFAVRPVRRTFGIQDSAELQVCVYYGRYVVQSFQIGVEVVVRGEEPGTEPSQLAELSSAHAEVYRDPHEAEPLELNVTIQRRPNDAYQFILACVSNATQEAPGSEVRLEFQAVLTPDERIHLITKARRQLFNTILLFQDHRAPTRIRDRIIPALARVGRQLYLKLFGTERGRVVAKWMREYVPPGSTIQVCDLAESFGFPWSLVYDAPLQYDDLPTTVNVEGFWGFRYELALLTDTLMDTYQIAGEQIEAQEGFRILVGLDDHLRGLEGQKAFFAHLEDIAGHRLATELVHRGSRAIEALQEADQHLVYFFCHGYVERMVADTQLNVRMQRMLDEWSRTRSESPIEEMDDLLDVGDSWLRVTYGKLTLTMLRETATTRFRRHPLVFLNASESAQVSPLSDGFVPYFIQRGVRAVIGIECGMDSTFADQFARSFLVRLFQGQSVGRILLELRQKSLLDGNPLALAYTLYGSANLQLSQPLLSADEARSLLDQDLSS